MALSSHPELRQHQIEQRRKRLRARRQAVAAEKRALKIRHKQKYVPEPLILDPQRELTDIDRARIARALRRWREHAALSRRHVEQLTGIRLMSLGHYERGRTLPSRAKAVKLAALYGTTLEVLLKGTLPPQRAR